MGGCAETMCCHSIPLPPSMGVPAWQQALRIARHWNTVTGAGMRSVPAVPLYGPQVLAAQGEQNPFPGAFH